MKFFCFLAFLALGSCGDLGSDSSSKEPDEIQVRRKTEKTDFESEKQDDIQSPRKTPKVDFDLEREDEVHSFPLLLCKGHIVRKDNADSILTELDAFGENENRSLVELPGFLPGPLRRYLTKIYTHEELQEKCYRGLEKKFKSLAEKSSEKFRIDSESLVKDFELRNTKTILTYVLMPDKKIYEIE